MTIHRVVVTGSSGRAGRVTVKDLSHHGYDVLGVDTQAAPADLQGQATFIRADLSDLGQATEVLRDADAVIHLANIPAPGLYPPEVTFAQNTHMNYNVFSAACHAGLKRVVWASSETTLGLPFDNPPRYAPVDEAHYPYPESSYALSKVVTETMAQQFNRWHNIPFIGLRFSNIINADTYKTFPDGCWQDAQQRKWNLWGYIDEQDVALACRKSLTANVQGAESYIIAAADTVMNRPSKDLMQEVFPNVPVADTLGEYETLLAINKAREQLEFHPQVSWRDFVDG